MMRLDMKDRTVQWVSPNYVKTSLIQSLLLSLIILIILGVSLYMRIVLSAIAFAVTLLFQWTSLPNAFKSVAIDEKGIRCGKTVIEWHQVKNIHKPLRSCKILQRFFAGFDLHPRRIFATMRETKKGGAGIGTGGRLDCGC